MGRKTVIMIGIVVVILFFLFASGVFVGDSDVQMPGNEQTIGGDTD